MKISNPKGYVIPGGYFGQLHDGSWRKFEDEGQYNEYFKEELEDEQESERRKKERD